MFKFCFKKIPSKNIDFKIFHAQDYFTNRGRILKKLSLEMIKMIENMVQTLKRPFSSARPSYELRFGVDFGLDQYFGNLIWIFENLTWILEQFCSFSLLSFILMVSKVRKSCAVRFYWV